MPVYWNDDDDEKEPRVELYEPRKESTKERWERYLLLLLSLLLAMLIWQR